MNIELEIKKQISDFSFEKCSRVEKLLIEWDIIHSRDNISLTLIYLDTYLISIKFFGISRTKICNLWLNELFIKDVSDYGWENVKYYISDEGTDSVEFYCSDVELVSIEKWK